MTPHIGLFFRLVLVFSCFFFKSIHPTLVVTLTPTLAQAIMAPTQARLRGVFGKNGQQMCGPPQQLVLYLVPHLV